MKPTRLHFYSCLVLCMILWGCVPKDNEVEVPSLKLDQQELTVANNGGEVTFNAETNQLSITAFAIGEWAHASVSGKQIKVMVEPNTQGADRSTKILVNAGGLMEQVKLTQSAADLVLESNIGEIFFPVSGGSKTVSLLSNTGKWTVKVDGGDEWLTVTQHPLFNQVELTTTANEGDAPREAKLVANNGGQPKVIPIKQDAMGMYILPMDPSKGGALDVIKYELARGSILNPIIEPGELFVIKGPSFITQYKKMPKISYMMRRTEPRYKQAVIEVPDMKDVFGEPYKKFMTDNGFTVESEGKKSVTFVSEKMQLRAMVNVTLYPPLALVTFTKYAVQTKEYKTFDKLPLEPLTDVILKHKKYEDVKTYEADHGGTLAKEEKEESLVSFALFNVKDQPYDVVARGWFFITDPSEGNVGEVQEMIYCVKDPTLLYWNSGTDSAPEYQMTKEFRALLTKEGFTDTGKETNKGFHYWTNVKKNMVLVPGVIKVSFINEGKPVGSINMFAYDAVSSSSGKVHPLQVPKGIRMMDKILNQ